MDDHDQRSLSSTSTFEAHTIQITISLSLHLHIDWLIYVVSVTAIAILSLLG